jgi:hypothetical protein
MPPDSQILKLVGELVLALEAGADGGSDPAAGRGADMGGDPQQRPARLRRRPELLLKVRVVVGGFNRSS